MITFKPLLAPPTPPASKGTPSTTYKGFEFKFNDPIPLIKTFESSPGAPLFETIDTPATFPLINCCGDTTEPFAKSFSVTKSTVPVKSFFLTVPYPITTTSSNSESDSAITTSKFAPLTVNSTV